MKKNIKLKTLALCLAMVIVLTGLITANAFEVIGGCTCGGVYDNGFCSNCDGYQPAVDSDGDGYYEIGNAGQLYWFANRVNNGNTYTNAVLTADIVLNTDVLDDDGYVNFGNFQTWSPIGSDYDNYYGHFDGQGHTISGLYHNAGMDQAGLFGYIAYDAVVENVGLLDSYVYGGYDVGSIVGYNYGTVRNCYSHSYVYGSDDAGGIVGENQGTIRNCYSMGNISCDSSYVGGIAAYGSGSVTNCYYLKGSAGYGDNYGYRYGTEQVRSAFASGEVAGLLGEAFGQLLGTDDYPVFRTEENTLYPCALCPNKTGYANDPDQGNATEHTYEDGMCIYCGDAIPPARDEDGYYIITNMGELYWFADYVNNKGNTTANAKLGANIVVNENVLVDGTLNSDADVVAAFRVWTPIGSGSSVYTGTFDGQGYTISGLYFNVEYQNYVGLFSCIGSTAKVQNLNIEASYFVGLDYVGGVVAYNDGGTVENCHNTSNIISTLLEYNPDGEFVLEAGHYAGGIVGYNKNGTVKNCTNSGTPCGYGCVGGIVGYNDKGRVESCTNNGRVRLYDFEDSSYNVGGVVGCNKEGTVANCYNTAAVTASGYNAGGVVGSNNKGTIDRCYNTGDVSAYKTLESDYTEEDAGGVVCYSNGGQVTNCYYLNTVAEDNGYGTPADQEQFKSGEVAYLLNGDQTTIVFGQTIGTDDYPVFFDGENQVFAVALCPGKDGYANEDAEGNTPVDNPNHNFVDSVCTVCGMLQPPAQDEDGYYIITNVGELYWFADYVNAGNTSANAKLGANIVVNTGVLNENGTLNGDGSNFRAWTPIGSGSSVYTGTFDGQGYTISGLYHNNSRSYIGLFGYTGSGAVIKNLGVLDSYFYGSEKIGGVVGYNYGIIQLCYTANYVCGGYDAGGITGYNYGTVENCYSHSRVHGSDDAGGIVGENQGPVRNCYSMGSISCISNYYGGITGYGSGSVTNCYYLEGSAGSGSNNGYRYGTEQTREAFVSGDVAGRLGSAYGQLLGTDDYPVFRTEANTLYPYALCPSKTDGYSNDPDQGNATEHTYENNICIYCGELKPPAQDEDGYYIITTVGELYWFANHVNSGNTAANAKLGANIVVNTNVLDEDGYLNEGEFRAWTPIGNNSRIYTGTFDGQGYTISGLYLSDSSRYYVGLFGYIGANSVIKNVGVEDSYFYGSCHVGGVVGYNYYGTVTNCYNTGSVSHVDSYVGGVIGYNYYGTVKNCYNTGNIRSDGGYIGGIVGYNDYGTVKNCYNQGLARNLATRDIAGGVVGYNNGSGIVENCYNTGDVGAEAGAGGVVGINYGTMKKCYNTGDVDGLYDNDVGGVAGTNYGTIEKCYYLESVDSGYVAFNDYGTAKSEAQFNSGEVAYLLNGDQSEVVFGQLIGTDDYPMFFDGMNQVYAHALCPGKNGYSNEDVGEEIPEHNFVDGFCTICGAEKTPDLVDGYYIITNVTELYWFADYVNSGNTSANAKLGANIVVNTGVLNEDGTVNYGGDYRTWTPIGSESNPYTGTFDGQEYTISGLYCSMPSNNCVGLFGYVGPEGSVQNVSVENSYFYGYDYVGGIAGYNYGTVDGCANAGRIYSNSDYIGGVVGYNYGTVSNCYNLGAIRGDDYTGGVVGENYSTVYNCYNAGIVHGWQWAYGSIVGYNYGTVENCYYLEGTVGADTYNVSGIAVMTQAQFASGEVAYLLNGDQSEIVFGQLIGTDDYPMFFDGDNQVYVYKLCPGKDSYVNADAEGNAPVDNPYHNFVDSVCTICGELQPPAQDEDGYYIITTVGELYWFADYVNNKGHYDTNAKLGNDIIVNTGVLDEDGYLNEGEFRAWEPIGSGQWHSDEGWDENDNYYYNEWQETYTGHFKGQGFTIYGLYCNKQSTSNIGLFGYIGSEAKVENVNVADSYFRGLYHVGGIVGYNNGGTVENCSGDNYISASYYYYDDGMDCWEEYGAYTGGIVGSNYGTVKNCSNSGMVRGYSNVGGVVGRNFGIVENCSNSAQVRGNDSEDESYYVGGIVGYNRSAVTNCYNVGTVSGGARVGGIVGYSNGDEDEGTVGTVTNCYNWGDVSGYWDVGGVIGDNRYEGTVMNCYNSGIVSGDDQVGGVAGSNSGNVENCYYLEGAAEYDNEYGIPKTEEEFASGEVMLLLGEAFGQDLSKGEKWPTLGGPRYTMIVVFTNGEKIYYADLAEAVAAAKEDAGCTLIMLADSFKGEAVINAGAFNLEFRGKQMNSTLVVAENANITIKNGKFTNITAKNGGKVTINGETVILTGVLKAEDGEITIIEAAVEGGLKLEGIALNEILDRYSFGRNEDGEVTTAVTKICVIRPGADLSEMNITVDNVAHTGEEVTPVVVITIGGKTLVLDEDFVIAALANNKDLGINTAEVTIRAIAPYTGEKTVKFSIVNCATDFGAQIKELEDRLKALEENNELSDAIKAAIETIYAELEQLQSNYATIEELEAAIARIEALEDAIAALENRVSANETAIEQIRQELVQVQEDVMNALINGNADLANQIERMKAAINAAIAANATADAQTKAELMALIRTAEATLQSAIDKVAADLEQAKLDVNAAILAGDADLAQKIAELQKALDTATAVSNAADNALKAELADAVATLNAALVKLQNDFDNAAEEANRMAVIAFTLVGVGAAVCVGLVIFIVIDKRKLVK